MKRRVICWTVKEIVHPKMKSCHHLLTLMQFETCVTFLWNTKVAIYCIVKTKPLFSIQWKWFVTSAVKLWFKLKFSLYLTQSYNCQTCVPCLCFPPSYVHICFFLFPVPSMFFDYHSSQLCLISPHLFQFSSLFPSILNLGFSPCLMSVLFVLPSCSMFPWCLCFIKGRFVCTPRLLAPCGVVTIIWHWKTWNILHKL